MCTYCEIPYRALVSTEMNLCQAALRQGSHREQTAQTNGAPHETICHTYARCTLGSGSLAEGKGQLPSSRRPRAAHTHVEFISNAFALQCCPPAHSAPRQTQQPSPRIPLHRSPPPSSHINQTSITSTEATAFILQEPQQTACMHF